MKAPVIIWSVTDKTQRNLNCDWTVLVSTIKTEWNEPLITFFGVQVNNATARVMTNKKMTTPYSNGEGLAALPYGNAFCTVGPERWGRNFVTKLKRQTLPPLPPQRNKKHAVTSKCRVNPGCPSLLWHVSVYMLLSIFFIIAGWKLSPMVGGIYSPELYTGKQAFLYSYLTDTQQTWFACLPKLIAIRGQAKLFWFLQSAKHSSDHLFIYLFICS